MVFGSSSWPSDKRAEISKCLKEFSADFSAVKLFFVEFSFEFFSFPLRLEVGS